MKNLVIAALVAAIAIGSAIGAFATTRTVETTANVEVTVWQRVSDGALFLSTRPEGGRWDTHRQPLDMSAFSRSGNFRQGSAITVAVPVSVEVDVPEATPTSTATAQPQGETHWHCARTRVDGGCDRRYRPTSSTHTHGADGVGCHTGRRHCHTHR